MLESNTLVGIVGIVTILVCYSIFVYLVNLFLVPRFLLNRDSGLPLASRFSLSRDSGLPRSVTPPRARCYPQQLARYPHIHSRAFHSQVHSNS